MQTATGPFDRTLRRRRRERASADFSRHDFLVRAVSTGLAERLNEVNRQFPMALDLGCHQGQFAQTLALFPDHGIGTLFQCEATASMLNDTAGLKIAADEEALPFAPGTFDLIVSCLSLHAVNDLPGTLLQIRRALKPDGLFVGAMFAGATLTELRQSFGQAEIDVEGGLSPRVAPFADIRDAGALLQRAGLAMPVVDMERLDVTYGDPFRLLHELRGMGETNVLTQRRKQFLKRQTLLRMAEIYRREFAQKDGRVPATFEILYLTGWAPDAGQPKPLRPGSARHRLADALGTTELPIEKSPDSGGS